MKSNTLCKNCETDFNGKYCPICKQSANTNRITWHELLHQFMDAFFEVDRGFWHTITEMGLRPGRTIRDYLSGKRVYHFNPFLFIIFLGGMTSVLFSVFQISLLAKKANTESIEKINPVFEHKHFTIIGVVILFFLTLTDFIFYRQKKYSLPELLVSNAFQIGVLLFFLVVSLPFLYLQNYVNAQYHTQFEIRYFILVIFYCYLFLVRYQLYVSKSDYLQLVKIIIQLVLLCAVVQYRIAKSVVAMLQ